MQPFASHSINKTLNIPHSFSEQGLAAVKRQNNFDKYSCPYPRL